MYVLGGIPTLISSIEENGKQPYKLTRAYVNVINILTQTIEGYII